MRLRRTLAGLAGIASASLLSLTVAAAADLGSPRPVRPPDDFAPPFERPFANLERWTGFYLGATLGQTWGNGNADGGIGQFLMDQSGTVGTVFAGYNWQVGRTVLGVETDVGTGNTSSTNATPFGALTSDINAFGSFRGRAGFLLSPALLVYGTAGLAWSNMSFAVDGLDSTSRTFWGYQVGAGTELMLSDRVGLRLEYIYSDFGRQTFSHSGLANSYDPDSHTVRAGISFKF